MDLPRKLILPELPSSGGVYSITCLLAGKTYFGATNNLYGRARTIRSNLFAGGCFNCRLTDDYKRYGPDAFVFEVRMITDDVRERLAVEERLIRDAGNHGCYNFTRRSGIHNPGKSLWKKSRLLRNKQPRNKEDNYGNSRIPGLRPVQL